MTQRPQNKTMTVAQDRHGLSLIEVLVVAGIMGVLSVVVSSLLLNTTRQSQSISAKSDFQTIVNSLQSYLNNAQDCKRLFVPTAQQLTQFPDYKPTQLNPIISQTRPQAVKLVVAGTGIQEGTTVDSLRINKFRLIKKTAVDGGGNRFLLTLLLEGDRGRYSGNTKVSDGVGGSLLIKEFEVLVSENPSDRTVSGCMGMFNQQWAESTAASGKKGLIFDGNIVVGPNAAGTSPDYELVVNGTARSETFIYSDGTQLSDTRLKENIRELRRPLERVLQLHGVLFDWKDHQGKLAPRDRMGFLAQEVEKVFPEVVIQEPHTGMKTVGYQNLVPALVEALKEQQEMILDQKREIEMIRNELRQKQNHLNGR